MKIVGIVGSESEKQEIISIAKFASVGNRSRHLYSDWVDKMTQIAYEDLNKGI